MNSLRRASSFERSYESLNVRASDGIFRPSLRLDVDSIQSERIFIDYSIDALVPAATQMLRCLVLGTPVVHCDKKS